MIFPVASFMRAHCHKVVNLEVLRGISIRGRLTLTEPLDGSSLTNSSRLRSHSITFPSFEADRTALNERDTARTVTGVRFPKREALGWRSTDFEVEVKDQTDMVQSVPAVIKVCESAKTPQDSCPT